MENRLLWKANSDKYTVEPVANPPSWIEVNQAYHDDGLVRYFESKQGASDYLVECIDFNIDFLTKAKKKLTQEGSSEKMD